MIIHKFLNQRQQLLTHSKPVNSCRDSSIKLIVIHRFP